MADADDRLLPFAPEEFADRLEGLREAMEMHGLDACVLTSPRNLAYYAGLVQTGLVQNGLALPDGLVVTRTGSVILSAGRSAARARRRGHGEVLAYDEGRRDDFWRLAAQVAGTGKAIGCEADDLTLMQSEKLNGALSPRRGVDIALAAMQQRMIKSEAEVALIRQGAAVADLGARVMQDAVCAGARACDIAWAGRRAMEDEIARLLPDAEYQGTTALLHAGAETESPDAAVSGRRLKAGDLIGLTAAPVLQGYGAVLGRMRVLGDAAPARSRQIAAARALQARAAALVLPGQSCGQLAEAMQALWAELDLPQDQGAAFGGGLPGEPLLALRAGNETLLEPGMVICLSPFWAVPSGRNGAGGYGLKDLLLVTETGGERLAQGPSDPQDGPED